MSITKLHSVSGRECCEYTTTKHKNRNQKILHQILTFPKDHAIEITSTYNSTCTTLRLDQKSFNNMYIVINFQSINL